MPVLSRDPVTLKPASRRGSVVAPAATATAAKQHRLSIGHKIPIIHGQEVTESVFKARVWVGAQKAEFPGIRDTEKRSSAHWSPGNIAKRDICRELTDKSRRNMLCHLAEVMIDASCFTMALTLPAEFAALDRSWVHRQAMRLLALAGKSRNLLISALGGFWKQELQERGALHYHLLLWGVPESEVARVQAWFASRWILLVGMGFAPEVREKMRRVHMHRTNFQPVRSMAYFAKYQGKAETKLIAEDPVSGRWWGFFNRHNVPLGRLAETDVLPVRPRVLAQRQVRKLRQVKSDFSRFNSNMRALGMWGDGKPRFTRWDFDCGRFRKGTVIGDQMRKALKEMDGRKLGRVRFARPLRFGPVRIIGKTAQTVFKQVLTYAIECYRQEMRDNPF